MLSTERYGDRFIGSDLYYYAASAITSTTTPLGICIPTGNVELLEVGYSVAGFTAGTSPTLYAQCYYIESDAAALSAAATTKGAVQIDLSSNAVAAGETYIKKYEQDELVLGPTVEPWNVNSWESAYVPTEVDMRGFNWRLVLTGSPTSADGVSFWFRYRPFSDNKK